MQKNNTCVYIGKKSQNGDTPGPVELIVWPEQGSWLPYSTYLYFDFHLLLLFHLCSMTKLKEHSREICQEQGYQSDWHEQDDQGQVFLCLCVYVFVFVVVFVIVFVFVFVSS